MSYRIAQDFQYAGKDYWTWWAWIEADDAELDRVKEVVWILHPTFAQTRVRVIDRANKFQLSTAGWGTFLLRAEVALRDGETQLLKHHLRLEFPEPPPDGPSKTASNRGAVRPLTVFLSYSVQDSRVAAKLRQDLKNTGFDVLDQTSIDASDSLADALRRLIAQADAVLALVCEDEISPWVRDELATALSRGKPAFALLWPEASNAGIPGDVRTVRVDPNALDSARISELLRSEG